jgi:hypothetical protein
MSDVAYDYLFNGLFVGLLVGLTIYVLKTFGVRGLLLRFALVVDCMLVWGIIIHLKIPLTHLAIPKPHHGDPLWWWYVAALTLGSLAFTCVLFLNGPTRFVIARPRFHWPIWVIAGLTLVMRFGRGWMH